MSKIRIVKIPDQEAPEWVLEAWVGVEIPIDENFSAESGFSKVSFVEAMKALRQKSTEAATWWQSNVVVLFGGYFKFDNQSCELIP